MRVLGKVKKHDLVFLVDSGSTHNFIDQAVVKKLKCKTQAMTMMEVTVTNGETMGVRELCKLVKWEAQGLTQYTDFLVLPLQGCDLVLGVQWLKSLGPIVWDFGSLNM